MRLKLEYGKSGLTIDVPADNLYAVVSMNSVPALANPDEALEKSVASPIGSAPLWTIAAGKKTACIVISDITRPVPNKLILPPILKTLQENGISDEQITILVATGIHRPTTPAELTEMVGEDVVRNYRIVNHDSKGLGMQTFLGRTSRGTPIYVNKIYMDADLKILTGLIEPHFAAGYSGGRKSICPGICSLETVKVHHGPAFI